MEIVALVLFIIGFLITLIYGILLIIAFQTSTLWGLGCLLVPFVGLIFIIMHCEATQSPFLKSLLGIPFFILAMLIMPEGQPM
ncbi:hypothetical protein [Rubellicoccus peritrichatus]|uniref:Uncharacterized protein n=1 Tax=Rubellicoccus peritrichatus TaxID=3080537 RepID=A0AAQ3QVP4_9BACT|nr:hypothetical protein [Puniceicoccus sp. CR14]WOO41838.1 hypothetical protein RZN69_01970 [Puniceicoccus sp. CR14]